METQPDGHFRRLALRHSPLTPSTTSQAASLGAKDAGCNLFTLVPDHAALCLPHTSRKVKSDWKIAVK